MKNIVWIDLDNSPHVPLFIPIIKEIEKRELKVIISARDFAQTIPLLKKANMVFTQIGKHYGGNKIMKVLGLFIRVFQLIFFISKNRKSVKFAINHGSRTHVLACFVLGIPVYCGADYEHTESFIFSKFATKMWVPAKLSESAIKDFGIAESRLIRYEGYKEEIYLNNFVPDNDFKQKNTIPSNKTLITLRPPATQANYHNDDSDIILKELVKNLTSGSSYYTICLPRTQDQREILKNFEGENFKIPASVLDGLNLAYHSDLVISGGGTMNREAVLLNTPAISIFSGKLGNIDEQMEQEGDIAFIRTKEDIKKLYSVKKENFRKHKINPSLAKFLVDSFIKS
jgi:predicted glycosyltransferase